MLPQQDGDDRDQQAAGRVVDGQQQARPGPVQQAPGHRPADNPRQPEAHQDHAQLSRTRDAQDDPGERDQGEGVAGPGDHHPEPEPAERLAAEHPPGAVGCLVQSSAFPG
jgi:hypothetical protein